MKGLIANQFVLLCLVVLALGALFGVAWVTGRTAGGAAQTPASQDQVPVTSAIRACPQPGPGRVAVFAAPGEGQDMGQGSANLLAAPVAAAAGQVSPSPATAPLQKLTQPGRLWLSRNGLAAPARGRGPGGAVIVEATGTMAQGLDAEQSTFPPSGAAGTVTSVQCPQPGTDFWFLGPSPAKSTKLDLRLVNPDSQPAAVDVEIFTDSGPLQGNTDTGVAVPAGGSVVQSMAPLVKGSRILALHVRTSNGRVAAAVQAGDGWWPDASAPASQAVIPGLPGAGTGRRLYLADPGGDDAQVQVQAITPAGSYEPAGAGGIDVPSGSVVAVDLPSLNGIPAALRLTSAVPVTAAVAVGGAAFSAAAPPVQQQGVVADDATGTGYAVSVVLSAPDRAAHVRIQTAGPGGPLGTARLVPVPAGRSVSVAVTVPRAERGGLAGFAIVVSPLPGSGPVYAGRVIALRGSGVQVVTPVLSSPASVTLPAVSDAAGAALP